MSEQIGRPAAEAAQSGRCAAGLDEVLTDPTSVSLEGPSVFRAALSCGASFGLGRRMLRITDKIMLEDWEITETFTRSQGPGGQNVNKVSSAVELRFEAARSPNLPAPVKARLKRLAGRRWTSDGAVLLRVEETRSQARNRDIARDRLAELIRSALEKPKRRIPTRPTLGSKKRRLAEKAKRGEIKALRGKVTREE